MVRKQKLLFIDIIVNKNSGLSEGYTVNSPNIRLDEDVFKMSSSVLQKRLQDIFKTSSTHLQDVFQDVFKTSSSCLQDVFQTSCKVYLAYLQGVFMTHDQVKLFLLAILREVFNTFLRRTA